MQDFREQMERRQIKYKEEVLSIKECGAWRRMHYPHILPKHMWNLNLWENIREEAERYFDENEIAWHMQKHNLLSSQVMCVNIFFPLRQHLDILKVWLSHHFNELEEVEKLDFEYTGPENKNYFNEPGGRGQNRTSSDLSITWQDKEKRKNMLLLEFKFTEPDFGQCNKHGNPDHKRCLSSKDIVSSHKTQCYRSEVRRPYWDMILSSDSPFRKESLTTERYCPFHYDFYQLMRNQLLAHCIQSDPEEDFNKVEFGVIYHADNEVLTRMSRPFGGEHNPLKAWRNLLKNPDTFHAFRVQEFLNTIEPKLHGDLINWRAYLKQRYDL
jgi:hypothetical protein